MLVYLWISIYFLFFLLQLHLGTLLLRFYLINCLDHCVQVLGLLLVGRSQVIHLLLVLFSNTIHLLELVFIVLDADVFISPGSRLWVGAWFLRAHITCCLVMQMSVVASHRSIVWGWERSMRSHHVRFRDQGSCEVLICIFSHSLWRKHFSRSAILRGCNHRHARENRMGIHLTGVGMKTWGNLMAWDHIIWRSHIAGQVMGLFSELGLSFCLSI